MLDNKFTNEVFADKEIFIEDYLVPFGLMSGDEQILLRNASECLLFILQHERLVVSGRNGAGKTLFLQCIADATTRSHEFIPIFVDFCEGTVDPSSMIAEQLKHYEHSSESQKGGEPVYLFLFDNMNCIKENRGSALEKIEAITAKYTKHRVVLTSLNDVAFAWNETHVKLCPFTFELACSLWEKLDACFRLQVGNYVKGLIKEYQEVFNDYVSNPLFATLLYRVCIFFKAAAGTKYDAFAPLPNRHKFFKFRHAIEQIMIQKFKRRTSSKEHQVISNERQVPRLPVVAAGNGDFVIEPHSNGIGDLLWFSHLPRLVKESGRYNRVLVSRAKFENDLIWNTNPYVDGYCDDANTQFKVMGKEIDEIIPLLSLEGENRSITINGKTYGSREINLLDWLMLRMNVDDGTRFHRPELYYRPVPVAGLTGKVLYDPYWWSNPRIQTKNFFLLDTFFKRNGISVDYQMKFIDDKANSTKYTMIPTYQFDKFLSTVSIFDFCDVLASVGEVYCLTTGTAHLTDALKVKTTVLLDENLSAVHHSRHHSYVCIA